MTDDVDLVRLSPMWRRPGRSWCSSAITANSARSDRAAPSKPWWPATPTPCTT